MLANSTCGHTHRTCGLQHMRSHTRGLGTRMHCQASHPDISCHHDTRGSATAFSADTVSYRTQSYQKEGSMSLHDKPTKSCNHRTSQRHHNNTPPSQQQPRALLPQRHLPPASKYKHESRHPAPSAHPYTHSSLSHTLTLPSNTHSCSRHPCHGQSPTVKLCGTKPQHASTKTPTCMLHEPWVPHSQPCMPHWQQIELLLSKPSCARPRV
jgi:hypothetical protein